MLNFTSDLVTLTEAVKGKHKMHGILIHPGKTFHPREAIRIRDYWKEDLKNAAETLKGKEIDEDHCEGSRRTAFAGCAFDYGKWNEEECGVEFEATVTDELADLIKAGRYQGVSAAMNWMRQGGGLRWVDGVSPYNFEFVRGSMITKGKGFTPGDTKAYFKLLEATELYRKKNGLLVTEGLLSIVKKESIDEVMTLQKQIDDLYARQYPKSEESEESKRISVELSILYAKKEALLKKIIMEEGLTSDQAGALGSMFEPKPAEKIPPSNSLESREHVDPNAPGAEAESKEGTKKEEKDVMRSHVNQSNEYAGQIKSPDRKFPLGEYPHGSSVSSNGGLKKNMSEKQGAETKEKVYVKTKEITEVKELTEADINKIVQERMLEALRSAQKDKTMTALSKNLVEMENFLKAAVTKGIDMAEAQKEWIARIDVKNTLSQYPQFIQESYTARLESDKETALTIKESLSKEWTNEQIKTLPDVSFAYVSEGKRHLPFKDKDGKINVLNLNESIDQLTKVGLTAEPLSMARKVLREAAKLVEITSPTLDLAEAEYLVDARKQIVDLKAQNATLAKERDKANESTIRFAESIEAILPKTFVEHSWAMAPKRLVQDIRARVNTAKGD